MNFQQNLGVLYLTNGKIFSIEFFTIKITFEALQDSIDFSRFKEVMCFRG